MVSAKFFAAGESELVSSIMQVQAFHEGVVVETVGVGVVVVDVGGGVGGAGILGIEVAYCHFQDKEWSRRKMKVEKIQQESIIEGEGDYVATFEVNNTLRRIIITEKVKC